MILRTFGPVRFGQVRAFAALLTLLAGMLVSGAAPARAERRFLAVSDIHFNPLADASLAAALNAASPEGWQAILDGSAQTAFSPYGSDANWPLVRSALAAMKAAEPTPAFILLTGDSLAHDFGQFYAAALPTPAGQAADPAAFQSFAARTVTFLLTQIERTFPGVPVLGTLGNNDDDCGDYELQPGGPFLQATVDLAKRLAGRRADPAFVASWLMGGNYSVPHPTLPKTRVISLNSVYLTPKYKNACGSATETPAASTLAWLGDALAEAAAAGERVWLIQHVPPGIDAYSTASYLTCPNVAPMIAPAYQAQYYGLLTRFERSIAVTFAGHTHMDDVRLIGKPGEGGFTLITPAVSPVFDQNPAFRTVTMADDGRLLDHTTHYLTNLTAAGPTVPARWEPEYSFRTAWGVDRIDRATLDAVYARIKAGGTDQQRYVTYYGVSTPGVGITTATLPSFLCAATAAETADFTACYCGTTGK